MIFERQLAPGSGSRLALAREWQISRTPLREALKVLAAEGLVLPVPRQGCKVAEMSRTTADELLPIMALLEGRCAYEAVRKAGEADIRRLQQLHAQLDAMPRRGTSRPTTAPTTGFHSAVQALAEPLAGPRHRRPAPLRAPAARPPAALARGASRPRSTSTACCSTHREQRDARAPSASCTTTLMAQLAALKALRQSERRQEPRMLDELKIRHRGRQRRAPAARPADRWPAAALRRGEANSVAIARDRWNAFRELPRTRWRPSSSAWRAISA